MHDKHEYPRMNPGAVLICDDYGFTSCPGATRAVDEFLADKPEAMLAFASGGGWFMRGHAVGHCPDSPGAASSQRGKFHGQA